MRTLLVGVAALVGCAEVQRVPTAVTVRALATKGEPTCSSDKVHVGLGVVATDSLARFQGAMIKVSWRERDQTQARAMGSMGGTVGRSAVVPLVPLPTLYLRIVNETGHALDFTHATFELKDSAAKSYRVFASTAELQGHVAADLQSTRPALVGAPETMESIYAVINKLPYLPTSRVSAGEEWKGYLTFDLGVHDAAELDGLLQGIEGFALKIANVLVEGGTPIEVTASLERVQVPLQMLCAGGAPPSVRDCKMPE